MKVDEREGEQNTSVAQILGIQRSLEELRGKEEQLLPGCQWNEKNEEERKIKRKKVKEKEVQIAAELEGGKKKRARERTEDGRKK